MRRRRASNNLGADPRGDTGASALSTLDRPPISATAANISHSPGRQHKPGSKRRRARGYLRKWRDLSLRHTWVSPLVLVLIIVTAYIVRPTVDNPIHSLIFLSYPLPQTSPYIPAWVQRGAETPQYYGKGSRDLAFVGFYIIVLSFTREFLMQRLIRPIAIHFGIRGRSKQNRFMEQAYTAVYFAIFGPYGLYIMFRTPVWYFNTIGMYEGFPHRAHEGAFKAYYLLQASYWAQQAIVLVLQLEKPRKDFRELVGHHIITLALIWLSYRFHFTYMGLAVYITHDISDFFLATSKTLNYISSPIVVPYFSLFIVLWIYLRHYINITILYSITNSFRTVGPFDVDWEKEQYKCWISQYITFALLACLQSINLFWLFFIVRIAVNVVFSDVVKDVRSDDEEEDERVQSNFPNGKETKVSGQEALDASNGHAQESLNAQLTNDKVDSSIAI